MAWNYKPLGKQLASEFNVGDKVRVKATKEIGVFFNTNGTDEYCGVRIGYCESWYKPDELELLLFNEPDVMRDYVEAIK